LYTSGEIGGHTTNDEVPRVIANECTPALRQHAVAWRSTEVRGHVLADRTRRNPQAEFEPQFIGNAPLAPREIVACHLPDERLQFHRDRWPSREWCAAPELFEPLAPPPDERLRLHHRESLRPVEPLRQPDQSHANGIGGAPWLDMVFLVERQLFPQKEVFCGKRRRRT
jgi:hypothetical protein